jgi:hypothetical protein
LLNPYSPTEIKEAKIELFEGIPQLDEHDLIALRGFLRIINFDRGNARTPVESFIVSLSHDWTHAMENGRGLTPDDIIRDIEVSNDGMREWFNDAVATARDFNRRYAGVLALPGKKEEE